MTTPHLTRRRLLQATSGAAVGLAGAGAPAYAAGSDRMRPDSAVVPLRGAHQAGIVTPPPDRIMFAAFDLMISTAGELRELLQVWTEAAAKLAAGHPAGPPAGALDAAPKDTGEALGLPPSSLTVTFGLGPDVFRKDGHDRFGLAARRPRPLAPLGRFRETGSTRPAPVATCASRPAPTTRRSRSTPCGT